MKKLVVFVVGAAAALFAVKQAKAGQEETARWSDLVDSVKRD